MAERQTITTLSVITDSETSYDNIGDIDGGGFDKGWLKKHIKNHGTEGLLRQLAWMNFQIYEAMREVNMDESGACIANVAVTKPPANLQYLAPKSGLMLTSNLTCFYYSE